jgi:hypothetical protein
MSTTVQIMFPVGRWVSGSIFDWVTKGDKGETLPDEKQHISFGYAIPKTPGRDWRQEPWGAQIAATAAADWPNGESNHPSFSFKVKDGDSAVSGRPNTKAPKDHEGWPGCWILFFRSGFEAAIVNANGSENFALRAQKQIKKGDYLQVFGSCKGSNNRPQNAGCYLNHDVVAFAGKGQEIVSANRPDPTKLGFGGTLPAGATAPQAAAATASAPAGTAAPAPTAVQPHPSFLTPGAPAAPVAPTAPVAPPVRQMTAKANGVTYEAFIAAGGWTDELLRAHGYMV